MQVYHAYYKPLEFYLPGTDSGECYIKVRGSTRGRGGGGGGVHTRCSCLTLVAFLFAAEFESAYFIAAEFHTDTVVEPCK